MSTAVNQLYTTLPTPVGQYASALEHHWAWWFNTAAQWDAEYIGHECAYADFRVGRVLVEVKPYAKGQRFLRAAANRYWKVRTSTPLLVVTGRPRITLRGVADPGEEGAWFHVSPGHTTIARRRVKRVERPEVYADMHLKGAPLAFGFVSESFEDYMQRVIGRGRS